MRKSMTVMVVIALVAVTQLIGTPVFVGFVATPGGVPFVELGVSPVCHFYWRPISTIEMV